MTRENMTREQFEKDVIESERKLVIEVFKHQMQLQCFHPCVQAASDKEGWICVRCEGHLNKQFELLL